MYNFKNKLFILNNPSLLYNGVIFIGFILINCFSLFYPELRDSSSNTWLVLIVTFKLICASVGAFLLPGLFALYAAHLSTHVNSLLFTQHTEDNYQLLLRYWAIPVLIMIVYIDIGRFHLPSIKLILIGVLILTFIFSSLTYLKQAPISMKKSTIHDKFFIKRGYKQFCYYSLFFFGLNITVFAWFWIINRYFYVNNPIKDSVYFFFLGLVVLILPSFFMLIRDKNIKHKKIPLIFNIFFTCILIFVYCSDSFYTSILRKELKNKHLAHFTDINYAFRNVACEIFIENGIKIKQISNKSCMIDEPFETTWENSTDLFLDFKEKAKITIKKEYRIMVIEKNLIK